MNDKPLGPARNHCYLYKVQGTLYIVQDSLNRSIRTRKGKYPVLKINTKFHQFIKHAKISYSIASLVFYKFLCVTYPNDLNQGTSSLGTPKGWAVLVKYLSSGICIFVCSWRWYSASKIYLFLEDNRSSFSRVSLKSETKDGKKKLKDNTNFWKKNLTSSSSSRWANLYITLNSWRSTNS